MNRSCREVEALIDRRRAGLRAAEQLVLEQHLSECESCRQVADVMQQVVATIERAPANLSDSARERALQRAFESAATPSPKRAPRAAPTRVGLWLSAAAVLLLVGRFALQRPESAETREARAPSADEQARPPVASRSAPAAPALADEPSTSEQRAEAPAPRDDAEQEITRWVDVPKRETRSFAHARVEVAPGSRLRFREESTTLELARGRVQVEVDARRAQTFSVLTRNFRVQVLGTAFSVTPERVQVRRGRVQVFDRRGHVLARELSSGATFTYREPAAGARAGNEGADAQPRPAPTERTDGALLARARAALAASDVASARAAIAEAERRDLTRADRAEAHTLRAQCALLERDVAAATRIYLEVAARFGDLAAGENAAFAAAQLTARAGDKSEARSLFEAYLTRYPEGRFAVEARARLAAEQQ